MNVTHTRRPRAGTCLLASSALCCLLPAVHARADNLLVAQTTLISGTESTVDSFTVPSAGTVTVQLSDLPWPMALSSLSFMATSGNQVLSSWSTLTSGVESFQVTPGTYFAHVTGTAGGALDLGLYSMTLTFQPAGTVPLPGSGWLLLIRRARFLLAFWRPRWMARRSAVCTH